MSKKIQIPTRPPKQPSADDWIADKEPLKEKAVAKPVRMTVELDPDIHREPVSYTHLTLPTILLV